MKYNELKLQRQKKAIRRGRGISAGRGKTAGRGTKGQNARKSGGVRPGFEGGQMPLYMRLPKLRGFKSHRRPTKVISTGQLNDLPQNTVDQGVLFKAGFISSPTTSVKLIFKGEVTVKKEVRLSKASSRAIKAVTSAGGNFISYNQPKHIARSNKELNQDSLK